MLAKRNAALEALGAAPRPVLAPEPMSSPPNKAASKRHSKVMVYLHPKVARKFKEIAFVEERKANEVYLDALDLYLRQQGHGGLKDVIER
jgi:hypothetical protein